MNAIIAAAPAEQTNSASVAAEGSAVVPVSGATLNARRTAAAMGQKALSRASGVPQSTISELESGEKTRALRRTVEALAAALGCGTSDLLGEEPPAPVAGIVGIPHNRLRRSDLNPRRHFDAEALEGLADSIAEKGIQQNIVVRADPEHAGDYLIIGGERRWRAVGLLIERDPVRFPADALIPSRVVEADDAEHRALAILENLQREQVPPLDEAEAFRALVEESDWSTARIARSIGKTERHVQLRLALLKRLHPDVQTALADERISLNIARALTAAPTGMQPQLLDLLDHPRLGLRTADDLTGYIRTAIQPAKRAFFDLARYCGERFCDPDTGEEYLLDAAAFNRLQTEAVDAKARALRADFGWVDIKFKDDWQPGGPDGIALAPSTADASAAIGAVIRVASNLAVTVFTGLTKREPAENEEDEEEGQDGEDDGEAESGGRNEPDANAVLGDGADPVAAVTAERRLYALQTKTRALQAALLEHPDGWLHQLALALMGCRDLCDIVAPPPMPQNAVVAPEVAAALDEFRGELGADLFLPPQPGWPYLSLARRGPDAFTASVAETALIVLSRLRTLSVDRLARLLAALTASRCATRFMPARPNLGDAPLAIETAAAIGASVNGWRLDDAYLATLAAPQLDRLARAIGAVQDDKGPGNDAVTPATFAAFTRKDRIEHLCAFAATHNRHPHPPELRFATRAEIEAALREETTP